MRITLAAAILLLPAIALANVGSYIRLLAEGVPAIQFKKLLGGFKPVQVSTIKGNSDIQNIVNFGLAHAKTENSKTENSLEGFDFEEIVGYATKVINGLSHRLSVIVKNSNNEKRKVTMIVNRSAGANAPLSYVGSKVKVISDVAKAVKAVGKFGQVRKTNGGWTFESVTKTNEDKVRSILNYGIENGITKQNSLEGFSFDKITAYWTQVVNGINHKFVTIVKNSNGEKRKVTVVVNQAPSKEVKLSLVSSEVDSVQTIKTKAAKALKIIGQVQQGPGKWKFHNPSKLENTAYVNEIIAWGIEAVNRSGNALQGFNTKEIVSYSTQVVSGMNHRFTVRMGNANGESRVVKMTIFDQPWTKTRQLKKSKVLNK